MTSESTTGDASRLGGGLGGTPKDARGAGAGARARATTTRAGGGAGGGGCGANVATGGASVATGYVGAGTVAVARTAAGTRGAVRAVAGAVAGASAGSGAAAGGGSVPASSREIDASPGSADGGGTRFELRLGLVPAPGPKPGTASASIPPLDASVPVRRSRSRSRRVAEDRCGPGRAADARDGVFPLALSVSFHSIATCAVEGSDARGALARSRAVSMAAVRNASVAARYAGPGPGPGPVWSPRVEEARRFAADGGGDEDSSEEERDHATLRRDARAASTADVVVAVVSSSITSSSSSYASSVWGRSRSRVAAAPMIFSSRNVRLPSRRFSLPTRTATAADHARNAATTRLLRRFSRAYLATTSTARAARISAAFAAASSAFARLRIAA